jgi:hypothetical protein
MTWFGSRRHFEDLPMSDEITLPTTQRAYTLRLRGPDSNDSTWRDARAHDMVCKMVARLLK